MEAWVEGVGGTTLVFGWSADLDCTVEIAVLDVVGKTLAVVRRLDLAMRFAADQRTVAAVTSPDYDEMLPFLHDVAGRWEEIWVTRDFDRSSCVLVNDGDTAVAA